MIFVCAFGCGRVIQTQRQSNSSMNPRRGVSDSMNGVGISPKRDATMVSPHGSPPLPSITALNDKQQRRARQGRKSPTGPAVGHVSPGKSGRKEPRGTLGATTGRYGAALTEPCRQRGPVSSFKHVRGEAVAVLLCDACGARRSARSSSKWQ